MNGEEALEKVAQFPRAHLRVLGPPRSGKTDALLRRYSSLRSAGADPLIVTYSRESADRLAAAVMKDGHWVGSEIPVRTCFEIAGRCFPRFPAPIGDLEETALVGRVLSGGARRLESAYRRLAGAARLKAALLGIFRFLMQNGIGYETGLPDSTRWWESLPGKSDDERVADIFLLYRRYLGLLRRYGLVTFYDLYPLACQHLADGSGRDPAPGKDVLLIDDFQDIDPGQFALFLELAPPRGDKVLNVFGDPTGPRFRHRGTSERFLLEVFPERYQAETIELGPCSRSALPLRLIRPLLRETMGTEGEKFASDSGRRGRGGAVQVRVVRVSDEIAEANLVASVVEDMVCRGKVRPEEIAVVARNKNRYRILMSLVFRQYGIPLDTGSEGIDAPWSMLASMLEVCVDPDDQRARERLVSSPLWPLLDQRLGGIGEGEAREEDRVDLLVRRLSERGSEALETALSEFLLPLLGDGAGTPPPGVLEMRAASLLARWRRYRTFAARVGLEPDLRELMGAGGVCSQAAAVPAPGTVGLYSCHEVSHRNFPVVFLVGCSETVFPSLPDREELIPYRELKRVLGGSPRVSFPWTFSVEEHLRDEISLLLHTMARAEEQLVITAPREFAGEELAAPAEVIRVGWGEESVEEAGEIRAPASVALSALAAAATPSEEQPALGAGCPGLGKGPASDGGAAGPGGDRPRQRPDRAAALQALSLCSPLAPLWGRGVASGEFCLQSFPLSKSTLGLYSLCPRKFFYERVLHLPVPDAPSALVGIMLHRLLAELGKRCPTREALLAMGVVGAEPFLRGVMEEEGVDAESLAGRLSAEKLRACLRAFLAVEEGRKEDYRIEGVEEDIPFEHAGWRFTARVDRMERLDSGGLLLVDYKTGREDKTAQTVRRKVLGRECRREERNWQVPLFLAAVRGREGAWPAGFSLYLLREPEKPRELRMVVSKGGGGKGAGREMSSLAPEEIEGCLEDAAALAAEIFSTREGFAKTEDTCACFRCFFKELCGR